jgi:hypothetical protein
MPSALVANAVSMLKANHRKDSEVSESLESSMGLETTRLARRLLLDEADIGPDSIVRVCDKLRVNLSSLVGVLGFCALLQRALAVSRAQTDCFDNVTVGKDGTLEGFDGCVARLTKKQIEEGTMVLVVHLIVLLETFLGEALTQHLLHDIWAIPNSKPKPAKMQKI